MMEQDTIGTGHAEVPDPGEGSFDPAAYAGELEAAPANHEIGTSLWFENERVRVFEIRLEPGQRGPFHVHDRPTSGPWWHPGRGLQRFVDGTLVVRDYALGETKYLEHSPEDPLVHDLENVGDSTLALRHRRAEALRRWRPRAGRRSPSSEVRSAGSSRRCSCAMPAATCRCSNDRRPRSRDGAPGSCCTRSRRAYFEEHGLIDLGRVSSSARTLRYLTSEGDVLLEEPIVYRFTSYATLYAALVDFFEPDRYHLGKELVAGSTTRGDGRAVRRRRCRVVRSGGGSRRDPIDRPRLLFPDLRPAYAGYVGWRGTLPRSELPGRRTRQLRDVLTYHVGERTHVLSYEIPGHREAQGRSMNWVWYRNVPDGPPLEALLTDRSGTRHDLSLPAGAVGDEHLDELRAAAGDLPPPSPT